MSRSTGRLLLDSSWEALFWGLCKFLKVPIERVDRSEAIEWKPGCWYAPDFKMASTYVEVKGLEDDGDPERWIRWQQERSYVLVIDQQMLDHLRKGSRLNLLSRLCLTEADVPSPV